MFSFESIFVDEQNDHSLFDVETRLEENQLHMSNHLHPITRTSLYQVHHIRTNRTVRKRRAN
jgi:hypothetical protein